ncbi:MAG: hypothetical protein DCC75_07490 [Proteobacteria bacterium]|nr:MAG: hypothetical protein DCC75_07490 [Pseudomonadota bacterium]
MLRLILITASIFLSAWIAGCGGGSSNSFSSGAARVEIDADPRKVDVGDRVEVNLNIEDVDEAGVIIKIRFPNELTYIEDSSIFYVDDEELERSPDSIHTSNDNYFLIYRISEEDNGENNRSTLVFDLRADDSKKEANLAVDPDINSNTPFDPDNPEFESEIEVEIEIEG